MKRLSISLLLFLVGLNSLLAQINLEATYQNANSYGGTHISFTLAEIDSGLFKYLLVDYNTSSFTLYNLNHSVYKNVNIPITWSSSNSYNIYYVSKSLFDCDTSNIEYLLNKNCPNYSTCPVGAYVEIYRENGNSIFHSDSAQAMFCFNCPTVLKYPIISTPNGTKMILEYRDSELAKVFSLCGSLPTSVANPDFSLSSNAYPNPSNRNITIEYDLKGDNSGEIQIFDINGKLINKMLVDNTFNNIILNTKTYDAGTYFYKIITSSGKAINNKFVVVK